MNYKFDDVSERDMDLLFAEELSSSKDFADIFLLKLDLHNAEIIELELSKMSTEFGESDITAIFFVDGRKHALLIEDKIDAIAMPRQCERYFERGMIGVSQKEYDVFSVFIIAPEKYLKNNNEAQKYPNKISYEECLQYFEKKSDNRSQFKYNQIKYAIYKQKHGYQVVENIAVTAFWDKYITYKENNYPQLWLTSQRGPKGAKSTWAHFNTVIKNLFIYHKAEVGFVDLNILGAGERIVEVEQALRESNIDIYSQNMTIVKTKKSAAIRICVPVIDFRNSFENYVDEIEVAFKAVEKLADLAKQLSAEKSLVDFLIRTES